MLKTLITIAVVALLAVPAALASPASHDSAAKACATLKSQMGADMFKQAYGSNADKSNAFGKCVAKMQVAADKAASSANAQCQAEQADANFAASHSGKTFAQFYGKNDKDKNAFGKCVAIKSKAQMATAMQKELNGAKACKAELKSLGKSAFAAKYGKNGNKANAFGKCVVAYVKAH